MVNRLFWLLPMALLAFCLTGMSVLSARGAEDVLEKHCSLCHSTEIIRAHPRPAAEWDEIVRRMAAQEGSELSKVDQLVVRKFLRENLESKK